MALKSCKKRTTAFTKSYEGSHGNRSHVKHINFKASCAAKIVSPLSLALKLAPCEAAQLDRPQYRLWVSEVYLPLHLCVTFYLLLFTL